MVFKATGRGHQNIQTLIEPLNLLGIFHPANNTGALVINMRAIFLDIIVNLFGQFARRHNNQRAAMFWRGFVLIGFQPLQYGQHKGGGFARAGLGNGDNVAALEHERNDFFLNRRRAIIAALLNRFGQLA